MPEFTDAVSPLDAAVLNTLVVAISYLQGGAAPTSTSGLTLTMPAQQVVINPGGGLPAAATAIAPTMLTLPANQDTYIDANPASGNGYTLTAVAVGATPVAAAAGTLRLYKATTIAYKLRF